MQIGKYFIVRASKIRKKLEQFGSFGSDGYSSFKEPHYVRSMQIYECRMFGLCFYRNENSFKQLKKELFEYHSGTSESVINFVFNHEKLFTHEK